MRRPVERRRRFLPGSQNNKTAFSKSLPAGSRRGGLGWRSVQSHVPSPSIEGPAGLPPGPKSCRAWLGTLGRDGSGIERRMAMR